MDTGAGRAFGATTASPLRYDSIEEFAVHRLGEIVIHTSSQALRKKVIIIDVRA